MSLVKLEEAYQAYRNVVKEDYQELPFVDEIFTQKNDKDNIKAIIRKQLSPQLKHELKTANVLEKDVQGQLTGYCTFNSIEKGKCQELLSKLSDMGFPVQISEGYPKGRKAITSLKDASYDIVYYALHKYPKDESVRDFRKYIEWTIKDYVALSGRQSKNMDNNSLIDEGYYRQEGGSLDSFIETIIGFAKKCSDINFQESLFDQYLENFIAGKTFTFEKEENMDNNSLIDEDEENLDNNSMSSYDNNMEVQHQNNRKKELKSKFQDWYGIKTGQTAPIDYISKFVQFVISGDLDVNLELYRTWEQLSNDIDNFNDEPLPF